METFNSKKFFCNLCSKEFSSVDGLYHHTIAKHPKIEKKPFKIKKSFIIYGVIIIISFLIIWLTLYSIKSINECKTADVSMLSIKDHSRISTHDHAKLKIFIDSKEQLIPANIGVYSDYMRPLHTHDGSGEIHIEGPCVRDYKLGDFFTVWGKQFNSQCLFENCEGDLIMKVDGLENNIFENLILKDGQEIVIDFKTNK